MELNWMFQKPGPDADPWGHPLLIILCSFWLYNIRVPDLPLQ